MLHQPHSPLGTVMSGLVESVIYNSRYVDLTLILWTGRLNYCFQLFAPPCDRIIHPATLPCDLAVFLQRWQGIYSRLTGSGLGCVICFL